MLYDEHILFSSKAPLPTVCVGNLAVGGTGKTPHTEFLARELSKQYKVAVLSRGYKRKTRGFRLADEKSTALTIGDEPMQMYEKLKGTGDGFPVVVAVCENRLYGIKRLRKLFPDLQLVILDDAFQHRCLNCGYNILLTSADNIYVIDHFLPYGRLRDNVNSALRANMIVVTKCKESMQPIDRRVIETSLHLPQYQQIFFSYLKYEELRPMSQESEPVKADTVLALTAIADPKPMHEYLQGKYRTVIPLAYSDHHRFSKQDIRYIEKTYRDQGCGMIITTEKDAARLQNDNHYARTLKDCTWILPVTVDFKSQKEQMLKPILHYLGKGIKVTD